MPQQRRGGVDEELPRADRRAGGCAKIVSRQRVSSSTSISFSWATAKSTFGLLEGAPARPADQGLVAEHVAVGQVADRLEGGLEPALRR